MFNKNVIFHIGYKAQHFFKEIWLDQPRSVPKSGCVLYPSIFMKQNARMSYFTVNWYKTNNEKKKSLEYWLLTLLNMVVLKRTGLVLKRAVLSSLLLVHFIVLLLPRYRSQIHCGQPPLFSSFSSSQTASSPEPSSVLTIPQDLNDF